jgi:choline dehydrogenase-like flavoprotein
MITWDGDVTDLWQCIGRRYCCELCAVVETSEQRLGCQFPHWLEERGYEGFCRQGLPENSRGMSTRVSRQLNLHHTNSSLQTTVPSMDGKLYLQQGFDAVSKGLNAAGFKQVIPNDHSEEKNMTYGHATFFIEHAERHGPLRSYLETAMARPKFTLMTGAMARRVVRTGGHVTGVELECKGGAGMSGTINVTAGTGRVIVAAGTMGSAKLLFRSKLAIFGKLSNRTGFFLLMRMVCRWYWSH